MSNHKRVTISYGDGIGPEIMKAVMRILKAAKVELEYDVIEVGEKVYLNGVTSGITPESWDVLRRNKVFLKAPITTPQGGGYKSLNVTIRTTLGLFANVRPSVTYTPYVQSFFSGMDMVIVRENEEDLYTGIEHQQTEEMVQCLKLISRPGCEKIVRYAFEYARANNRKKVTCMTKDNIMKQADGLFHRVFNEIAIEYPEIENDHYIIDIGSARIADRPGLFDVIVTLNLYGDIISDIASEVAGSVGLSGSANIGENFAMFEAIHGSAPDIAGKGIANPSGLLNGACMMLVHLGMPQKAEMIQNALLKTIEDGIHTGDIYNHQASLRRVGTDEFTDALIERLGQKPVHLKPVILGEKPVEFNITTSPYQHQLKTLLGVDVFLDWIDADRNPEVLGGKLEALCPYSLKLQMITNRGVKVYPAGMDETFKTDHWRCRFVAESKESSTVEYTTILDLLSALTQAGLNFIKIENLYAFNGKKAFSGGQD